MNKIHLMSHAFAMRCTLLNAINIVCSVGGDGVRARCNRQTSLAMHIKENDEFYMCISSTEYECVVGLALPSTNSNATNGACSSDRRLHASEQYKVDPLIVRIRHGKSANNNGKSSFGDDGHTSSGESWSDAGTVRILWKCVKDGNGNVQMMSGTTKTV